MYLLDTNTCIAVIHGAPARVGRQFEAQARGGAELCASAVTLFELRYGIEKSARRELNERQLERFLAGAIRLLSFGERDAARAGEIRATLERLGTPIGPFDTLIAGQALARGLVLVTHNLREFGRVDGLRVEDWEA